MPFHKLFKILILVLAGTAIGLVLLPANANAQSKISCADAGECVVCTDECHDGFICFAFFCPNGTAGACSPCFETKKHPMDFLKRTHGEQGDKVLLARLLSKDPEVSQALRSLK
jgi:hypothetical protein